MLGIILAAVGLLICVYIGLAVDNYYKSRLNTVRDYLAFVRFSERETEFLKTDMPALLSGFECKSEFKKMITEASGKGPREGKRLFEGTIRNRLRFPRRFVQVFDKYRGKHGKGCRKRKKTKGGTYKKTDVFTWRRFGDIGYMTGLETIFKIAGVGILAAVINSILEKSDKRELTTFVTLTALIIVLVMVIDMLSGLFNSIRSLFNLY